MKIPLEDSYTDIIGKTQRGLRQEAIPTPKTDEEIRAAARLLGLSPDALVASAHQKWFPAEQSPVEGFDCFNTPFEDMTVNSYLIHDPVTGEAAAFDTGTDCSGMLQQGLKIKQIFITHIHTDHILELDRLKEKTGAKAWVSEREPLSGAESFADGKCFKIGSLQVETRRTSGHAQGGTTFYITGLRKPIAIVGDALFAGSMGGGMVSFEEALRTTREGILTLPEETIVASGHGPLTTVGEEKRNNPFFAK